VEFRAVEDDDLRVSVETWANSGDRMSRSLEDLRPGRPRARRLLNDLHRRAVNFDSAERDRSTPEDGWIVDRYRRALPPEPPGPPAPNGSWDVARGLIRDYEFADPAIIRAVYQPEHPLADRDMLLEARFHGLRFHFGVRAAACAPGASRAVPISETRWCVSASDSSDAVSR
jgi:hypothetical protein